MLEHEFTKQRKTRAKSEITIEKHFLIKKLYFYAQFFTTFFKTELIIRV